MSAARLASLGPRVPAFGTIRSARHFVGSVKREKCGRTSWRYQTVALSTVAAATMIVLRLMGLVQVQGTALILVSIFFSLGVQSVYLMLLAYFIGRAASESSRKRPFVVMSEDEVA